jgi:hypothetical protein
MKPHKKKTHAATLVMGGVWEVVRPVHNNGILGKWWLKVKVKVTCNRPEGPEGG